MRYTPNQGDIIMMDFDPKKGPGQKGRRPALLESNNVFNQYSKLAMVCPIKNSYKAHVFHIPLGNDTKTTGVFLCDQTRALDVIARNADYVECVSDDVLDRVIDMVCSFVE